jgi:hypothetical protein
LNISADPHIRPILEAQGFSRYCNEVFIATPSLRGLFSDAKVKYFMLLSIPRSTSISLCNAILLEHISSACHLTRAAQLPTSAKLPGLLTRPLYYFLFARRRLTTQ